MKSRHLISIIIISLGLPACHSSRSGGSGGSGDRGQSGEVSKYSANKNSKEDSQDSVVNTKPTDAECDNYADLVYMLSLGHRRIPNEELAQYKPEERQVLTVSWMVNETVRIYGTKGLAGLPDVKSEEELLSAHSALVNDEGYWRDKPLSVVAEVCENRKL